MLDTPSSCWREPRQREVWQEFPYTPSLPQSPSARVPSTSTGQPALQLLTANSTILKDRSEVQDFRSGWHLEKVTRESLALHNTPLEVRSLAPDQVSDLKAICHPAETSYLPASTSGQSLHLKIERTVVLRRDSLFLARPAASIHCEHYFSHHTNL